jgi:hypothetical protein
VNLVKLGLWEPYQKRKKKERFASDFGGSKAKATTTPQRKSVF